MMKRMMVGDASKLHGGNVRAVALNVKS